MNVGDGPSVWMTFDRVLVRVALAAGVLVSACGTAGLEIISPRALEVHVAASGAQRVVVPYSLDGEMIEWLKNEVPSVGSDSTRLGILAERLLAPDGLGIEYTRDTTGTAREVFDIRRANCLAFTHLFVGMARELGIDVHFLEVRDLDSYSREDDLVVHSDHIAVGFGPLHQMTIIDFATEPGLKYRRIKTLTDVQATALYYSNRGTELLREGQIEGAYQWLADAVRIAPNLAAGWVNFGVALRRLGEVEKAELAYRQALEINPSEYSAYQNLATLLRMLGREKEAFDLLELTDASKNRNPYTFLALGDLSKKNGRWAEAERFYRRALRVHREDAEPLAAMGSVALHSGDLKAAERWLKRARKIDPAAPRVVILSQELNRTRMSADGRG